MNINTRKRSRIAHIITRLINGGADGNTVYCCNAAARQGDEVVLLHGEVTQPEIIAKLDPRVRRIRVPGLVRALSPVSDIQALWHLTRTLRAFRPDIVHTHTSKGGIIGRVAARLAGVPVIVHGVHIVPFENAGRLQRLVYLAAERATAPITSAFIDVSAGMRDLCVAAGVGRPDQHYVVHSGFDLDRFCSARPPEDWRRLLRLEAHEARPPVLLMMAAFEPRKRHREFLEHFPKIAAEIPNVKLLLAGDGPLRPEIEDFINANNLDRQVILAGFRDDPERLIALADLCLLCSMREGLPRVVVQYLAGGKPCVAADLPGLDEVLRNGENGVVTPPNDLAALAEAAVVLLADRQKLAHLAAGAARTDLSAWDATAMCAEVAAIYEAYRSAAWRAGPATRRRTGRKQVERRVP